jgi:hypothetical protein
MALGWIGLTTPVLGAVQQFCRICAGAEPGDEKEDVVWFALNDDRPLAAFAGIWTELRAQWCELPQDSMATRTGGSRSK